MTANGFYEHFKSLFSETTVFSDPGVENTVNDEIFDHVVDQLDCDFSYDEVIKAISFLRCQKSAGEDMLNPEIFLDSKQILAPFLYKLFNRLYSNCVYPDSRSKGILVPVPKTSDPNNADNYRGIMLTSTFSKIFSQVLDTRAKAFVENNHILTGCKYGFRQKRSTIDCIFVLQSLINRIIHHEQKETILCFCRF